MTIYQLLIEKLHFGKNCYTGFPANEWGGVWYGDPGAQREIFKTAIADSDPGLIIEVGSFVGESTIHTAGLLKNRNKDSAILAVDTWYGGFDHWKAVPEKLRFHFGRSSLFYQFIGNVIQRGAQDIIVPLALDSLNAARLLKMLGINARMVYVDGSHEKGDVLRDLEAYWALIEPGGVMLVDDLSNHFPAVVEDFSYFCGLMNIKPSITDGEKAILVKQ